MKLSQQRKFKFNYLLLAFLAPFLGMCSIMIVRGFEPFGATSMLYSDMYHQYYPFFVSFRRALLSGDSLLYNWDVGMGMDYLGLVSYYLASPLNLLSVFVPERYLLEYFSMLTPIKLGFAGLFFAIFLKKMFDKNDLSIVLFGSLYALCAWALGYQWNVMWLDTFAVLPLVALGTISLLREKKFVLYTFALFFSVLANYYIGFFTCIFIVLVFICYEICRWKGFKAFFFDLIRIALFSILAIGMTAILELPAYAALQSTQSSVNKFPDTFRLNIADEHTFQGLLDAMRQVAGNMNGGLKPTFKEGLPNLYCGIVANVFAFLFLTCKEVKLRDKICSVFLLLFLNVSFIIRQLDYIWHGFHFTNMIPYRFSFIYSFVVLYMAYCAYLLRSRFRLWQVILAGTLAIGIALCAEDASDPAYWLSYNGVFLFLYIAALVFPCLFKRPRRGSSPKVVLEYETQQNARLRLSSCVLACTIIMELVLNLVNFGANFTGTTVSDYPRGTINTASMIRYMKELEEDNLFYRTETTHSQTLNDGALNGYHGISTFTSSANVKVTKFMKALGYGAKETYNRYCFEESSPVANLFLNLKYMLERQNKVEENEYFDQVHYFGKVALLENNAYLPLGFMAENQLVNVDFSTSENTFILQNELFSAATGLEDDVWSFITGKNLSISGTNVTINTQTQTGYCSYSTGSSSGTIVYKYVADQEGLVCIDLNLSKKNKFSFWKNGTELYNETYSIPQSLSVSHVERGDVIEVHLTCKANEKGTITLHAGILNEKIFRQGYNRLASSTLELTHFSNTRIEGTVNCTKDGVLYTSIPQDGNWRAIVDGKDADIALIGDAMVGLVLPKGEHNIVFEYHNPAFSLGWKVSLISFLGFGGLYWYFYQPTINFFKRKKK